MTRGVLLWESSTKIQCRLGTWRKVFASRVSSAFWTGRLYVGVMMWIVGSTSDQGGGRVYTYSVLTTSTMSLSEAQYSLESCAWPPASLLPSTPSSVDVGIRRHVRH